MPLTVPLLSCVESSFIAKPQSSAPCLKDAACSHRLGVRPHILRSRPHRRLTGPDRCIALTKPGRQRSKPRAAFTENPQNVPDPKVLRCFIPLSAFADVFQQNADSRWFCHHPLLLQVLPKRGMSAIEAVEAQLNALKDNDEPWSALPVLIYLAL